MVGFWFRFPAAEGNGMWPVPADDYPDIERLTLMPKDSDDCWRQQPSPPVTRTRRPNSGRLETETGTICGNIASFVLSVW
jgi:hypothetical protein